MGAYILRQNLLTTTVHSVKKGDTHQWTKMHSVSKMAPQLSLKNLKAKGLYAITLNCFSCKQSSTLSIESFTESQFGKSFCEDFKLSLC